jgi:glutaredoxin
MKKTIIAIGILSLVLTGCAAKTAKNLNPEEAKAKATEYINTVLLENNPDYKAEVTSISEENGIYKMMVKINDKEIDSYMTKDGGKFFDRTFDMTKQPEQPATDQAAAPQNPIQTVNTKSAKPTVEIFVMSHCPYGTQIEKGILPAIKTLGDKVDFKVKFCDYAMHGEKELVEQMTQYCIQKNEPAKIVPYLECYLGTQGDAAGTAKCVADNKINKTKLNSCIAATDKQYKIKSGFADKSTWLNGSYPKFDVFKADTDKYGVKGSPTLVINGEQISSSRDSSSLLKTICSGFETAPGECQAQLSSENPSAGFGYNAGGNATDATCN